MILTGGNQSDTTSSLLSRRRGANPNKKIGQRRLLQLVVTIIMSIVFMFVFGMMVLFPPVVETPKAEAAGLRRARTSFPPIERIKEANLKLFDDLGPDDESEEEMADDDVKAADITDPVEDYDELYEAQIRNYKPLGGNRFQEYKDGETPSPITESMKRESDELARTRRVHIRNAMKRAWSAYKTYAWGYDELLPVSKKGRNNWAGTGATLVDSLDTLWLMGLKKEFWEARDWVRDSLNYDHVSGHVSVFETTIRSLGGLLAAYDLSGDEVFLEKADDLGSRLVRAFDHTLSGLPAAKISLNKGRPLQNLKVNLAEVGTLQVEFRYLSQATGNATFAQKANRVYDIIADMPNNTGLYPYAIFPDSTRPFFTNQIITFGAMGDSFYEYLLKVWIQGGRKESKYRKMYDDAMNGVSEKLVQKSSPSGLTYIADLKKGGLHHKMDHLACFLAGSLALGAYTHPDGLESEPAQRDLKTGKALAYTCYQMYARSKTGLGPESTIFSPTKDFYAMPYYYLLRPEVIESLFILNQLTGDPVYREWGWEIFQSIEKYCRTEEAYGKVKNVNNPRSGVENNMESFFLAETLKYSYLLQDPDTEIDILNKHVFNTEAHPLRIFDEIISFP